jgi:Ni/Co efflux regulator RcnB
MRPSLKLHVIIAVAAIAGSAVGAGADARFETMARRSPQTQAKRQRELDKQEKRRAKDARRALRKSHKSGDAVDLPGETDSDDARLQSSEIGPSSDSET